MYKHFYSQICHTCQTYSKNEVSVLSDQNPISHLVSPSDFFFFEEHRHPVRHLSNTSLCCDPSPYNNRDLWALLWNCSLTLLSQLTCKMSMSMICPLLIRAEWYKISIHPETEKAEIGFQTALMLSDHIICSIYKAKMKCWFGQLHLIYGR